ncbi:MAG TPA: YdcF family protein [Gemmatimonadales bacterium]|nr:YdcF family protein [Gemmatimonadales bacterium]
MRSAAGRLRRAVRALGLGLGVAALAYTVSFVLVLVVAQLDNPQPADAIVVLGAAQYNGRPSPVLRARLDHARELWSDGLAPAIIVTGGVGRGDTESEADVGRRYLLARRVPATAVVSEPEGRTTAASMTAVADRLGDDQRVILVSDPFHMLRLRLEARRTGLVAYTSPTDTSPISDNPVLELEYLAVEACKVPVAWLHSVFDGASARRS